MTWAFEGQLKDHREVYGKQVLKEKPGVDGSYIFCLRIAQSTSLLMALPFFCVLIQEEFYCQRIKGGCP